MPAAAAEAAVARSVMTATEAAVARSVMAVAVMAARAGLARAAEAGVV
jgi:hypothetical protein